jgi:hypothetical protein
VETMTLKHSQQIEGFKARSALNRMKEKLKG